MNKYINMVNLINKREQVQMFYQKHKKIVDMVYKGVLALVVLLAICRMFPYGALVNRVMIIVAAAFLQAFIPIAGLYYMASGFILWNLWKVSADLFLIFVVFLIVCLFGYFRVSNRYCYVAVVVPVLFYFQLGFLTPAVLAILIGYQALFPTAAGIITYYFASSLKESYTFITASEGSSVGVGAVYVMNQLFKNQKMIIMLVAAIVTILLTSWIYQLFHERARMISFFVGNVSMAFLILVGKMYCGLDFSIGHVLFEMILGIFLCAAFEFYKGIVDVSRTETTIFEDSEYIYYVKAVPKVKVTKSEPNITIINETEYEGENADEC